MQIALNAGWLPEKPVSPSERSTQKRGASHPLLPSLRPFLGLLPSSRGHDIRPVRTHHQHGMASMLVQRMYASRGYITETAKQRLDDPNRVTLAAWQYDEVIATLTLGRDSPSGLLADTLYAPEVAGLRRPDRIVCEVTRLAVDPDFASRDLLLSLFRAAHQYGKELFAASDVVIEVNPRHVGYYQRLLGFKQLGELRHCPRVAAPAVLLHQDLKHLTFPNGKPSWGERSHIDLHTHTQRSDRV